MRDYLHSNEIEKLLAAAKVSPRYGERNHLLVLLAVLHALRISEGSICGSATSTSRPGASSAGARRAR